MRKQYGIILLCFIVFILVSCSDDNLNYNKENILGSYNYEKKATAKVKNKLKDNFKLKTNIIYDSERNSNHKMGYISSSDIGKKLIYVLDEKSKRVTVWDRGTGNVSHYGSPGAGPGEFRSPEEIFYNDRIYIVDRGGILKEYSSIENFDGSERRINVGSNSESLCILNNKIYSLSPESKEGVIRKLDMNGKLMSEFGRLFHSFSPFIRSQVLEGKLYCLNKNRALILSLKHAGRIYAYTPEGDLKWISSIEGFNTLKYSVVTRNGRKGVLKNSNKKNYYNIISSFVEISESHGFMQVKKKKSEGVDSNEINSYVVDTNNGSGYLVNYDSGVLQSINDSLAVEINNQPEPKFKVKKIKRK